MHRDIRGHWVRLETLTRVRWLAVSGQVAALSIGYWGLGLQFNLTLCLLIVGVSVIANLLSSAVFPRSRRLSETEALLTLLFDTAQLSLLLYLTGGLGNPFALLLLAPVTIAATALQLRSTLILGLVAIALATLLALNFEPIMLPGGNTLILPDLFRFGFWLALIVGIAFIGLYSRSIAAEKHALTEALLATRMALAREQKLTDLGGVVAAAAHELGTPLATIKLASAELIDSLAALPELREDAVLIREQAERCREILRSMGRAGKDDLHLHHVPLETLLRDAAAPHAERGRVIRFSCQPGAAASGAVASRMPQVQRAPGVVHGLRNLIQNAVDFAAAEVRVEAEWDAGTIRIRVIDDGPGYPAHLLGRLGEPYLRDRREAQRSDTRREYEGMGLGLFIAKTLLERSGAEVGFFNQNNRQRGTSGNDLRQGAVAELRWNRADLEVDPNRPLGANIPHETVSRPEMNTGLPKY
ncbi:MAG: sensor histidine kinase RegB [Pararhodobacter sp.]